LIVAFKPFKAFFRLARVEGSAFSILASSAFAASVRLLKVFLRFESERFDIANDLRFLDTEHLHPQQFTLIFDNNLFTENFQV
jgi:hypothetical protein